MTTTKEKPGKIYEAINKIMAELNVIPKDKKNKEQGYAYRSIDSMYVSIHDLLVKHKVFLTKEILNSFREERETRSGGTLIYSALDIKFTYHSVEDGSFITDVVRGEGMDSGDKSSNKAMSAGYKYTFTQVFCIPTDEKGKDSEEDDHDVKPKATPGQINFIKSLLEKTTLAGATVDDIKSKVEANDVTKEYAQSAIDYLKQSNGSGRHYNGNS